MDLAKHILRFSIIGFLIISILGTLLHFTYKWFGYNKIIGAISSVNESVWEHLKIAVIPIVICMIVQIIFFRYFLKLDINKNLYIAVFFQIITTIFSILILYYSYKLILKHNLLIFDISIFYISQALGSFVSYKILIINKDYMQLNQVALTYIIILAILFILFTYIPPKCKLFKDPINNTYGIHLLK